MIEYYDKECNLITKEQWKYLSKDDNYVTIRKSWISQPDESDIFILTRWLGKPHGGGPTGPKIFRTDVYEHEGESWISYYATEEEALNHHNYLVEVHTSYMKPTSRWQQMMEEIIEDD